MIISDVAFVVVEAGGKFEGDLQITSYSPLVAASKDTVHSSLHQRANMAI